ncbi:cytochrome P450 [Streptomyces sp. NBC_00859]|uniref:cytochrome P450 n=1 Tax=Streptomyces sp. NBC_00859 TaxID=2903682 RepID=UPI003867B28D|nr:cytochrome P450 [Streptomyces sp. NBC_00859]
MPGNNALSLLDGFRPEWAADPYALYRRIRSERGPVHWDDMMRSWVVLDHATITRLGKDRRLSGARIRDFHQRLPPAAQAEMEPLARPLSDMMLFNEPPRHTRLRGLIKPGLTPRFIQSMRPAVQRLADELLDRAFQEGGGILDVVKDYAEPLTRALITDLSGVPADAAHLLEGWQSLLHELFSQSDREFGRLDSLREAFDRVAAQRRARTAVDRFSEVIAAQVATGAFTDDEVFANFLLLIDAGQATTTHLIANAVLALIEHPGQAERLREEPALSANGAHEFLRYDSSVQFTTRIALEDIETDGHRIDRGQSVTLVLGAGNRDPLRYTDPDTLDVTRKANDHLSFGHGIHYCLGAALSLAEVDIAVSTLLRRTAELRLTAPRLQRLDSINFRFLKSLPIELHPSG